MSRPRKRLLAIAAAALLAVTVGVALPASAEPIPGTITGHVTDDGAPVPFAWITVSDPTTFQNYFGTTDGDGAYTIGNVAPGNYRMSFQLPGGQTQYAVQKTSVQTADLITVTEGAVVTVDEAVAPHGSISGRVTRADGSPAAAMTVTASAFEGPIAPVSTQTDANGDYVIPIVWPGTYVVAFGGSGSFTQYAHGQTSFQSATPIEVAAGADLTVDETLLPIGAIAGRLTDGSGQPVMFTSVTVAGPTGPVGFGFTDSTGRYRVDVLPGTYTVEFRTSGGLIQYAHQKRTQAEADPITVAAGPDTIVDEQLLPTGTIAGRLTDSAGAPVPFVVVRATDDSGAAHFGFTSFDGSFSITAPPGSYTVEFSTSQGSQWARGKSSAEAADPIVVTAGQTTLLNESLAAPGTIVVTARDRGTGAPITNFCASFFQFHCTEDGTVTIPVLPGTHSVHISEAQVGDQTYQDTSIDGVVVSSGQATSVVADLARAAAVRTVIRDAATGEPVEGACIALVEPLSPSDLDGGGYCSGPDGAVLARLVRPSVYNVFVEARDGVHGHQWLGYRGGTGAQATARLVKVPEGTTVTVPDVKLDRAGRISGVVTDRATGQPISLGFVGVSSVHGRRGSGGPSSETDGSGRYTLDGLGPYAWTLFFARQPYGSQFSGGGPNRFLAEGVRVRVDQTTTYDVAMASGTTLIINLTDAAGQPTSGGDVVIVNALTGDEMGRAIPDVDPPYQLQVTAPQLVKLRLENFGGLPTWVGGADFVHAKVFLVPATGPHTITVKVP